MRRWSCVSGCVSDEVSAAVELNEELADEYGVIRLVRLWKLAVIVFDLALVKEEAKEL